MNHSLRALFFVGVAVASCGASAAGVAACSGTATGTATAGASGTTSGQGGSGGQGSGGDGPSTSSGTTSSATTGSGGAGATITFEVAHQGVQVPATIHVDALAVPLSSGDFLTARYEWDFGDASGKYDHLEGWHAAHIYEQAGTYTIALVVTDGAGVRSMGKMQVTVAPSTRKTYYVSAKTGDDANDGLSEQKPFKTGDKAASLLASDTEILFHAGETFDLMKGILITGSNVVVGSYGAGPKPILLQLGVGPGGSLTILATRTPAKDVTIRDLAIDSHIAGCDFGMPCYCPGTSPSMPPYAAEGVSPGGVNVSVLRIDGMHLNNFINMNPRPDGAYAADNVQLTAGHICAANLWGEGHDVVVLGNKGLDSPRENTMRVADTGVTRGLFAFNDMSIQPNAKYPYTFRTADRIYVWRNTASGNGFQLNPRGPEVAVQNSVFEGNHLVQQFFDLRPRIEHVHLRNNLIENDDGPCISAETNLGSQTPDGGAPIALVFTDVLLYNNTCVGPGEKTKLIHVWSGPPIGMTLENNLHVDANLNVVHLGSGFYEEPPLTLKGFSLITNLYPIPKVLDMGGINFANGMYYSPMAWDALPEVKNDLFENLTLDAMFAPPLGSSAGTKGTAMPGLHADYYGAESAPGRIGAVNPK